MPHPTPGPVEIEKASRGQKSDAIPYADLRSEAKREVDKQRSLRSDFKLSTLKTIAEVIATLDKARVYRDQRAKVMVIFKRAMGRLESAIRALPPKDPRKPKLDAILKTLKSETTGHEKAIEQVNDTLVNGKKMLEAMQRKEREEAARKAKR